MTGTLFAGTYRRCSRKTLATQTASNSKRPMTTAYLNRWCLLALSIGVSSFATVRAQTLPIAQAPQSVEHQGGQPPLCDPELIDTTFTFASLPAGEQTVSSHFQNKSSTACDFILRTTGADQGSSGRHRRRSTRASNGTRCHKNVILMVVNGGKMLPILSSRIQATHMMPMRIFCTTSSLAGSG